MWIHAENPEKSVDKESLGVMASKGWTPHIGPITEIAGPEGPKQVALVLLWPPRVVDRWAFLGLALLAGTIAGVFSATGLMIAIPLAL